MLLNINRGAAYIIGYQHYHSDDGGATKTPASLVGCNVYFTTKTADYLDDRADSGAYIQKTLVNLQGDDAANGYCEIELSPNDTKYQGNTTTFIDPNDYPYDIWVKEADGRPYKVDGGTVTINPSVTNRAGE